MQLAVSSGNYLLPGDILLYENHHVATNITKGKRAAEFTFDTKAVQTKLISLGYSCGPDGADGDFGPNTASAVKAFQNDHKLKETGEVDQATLTAIQEAKITGPHVTATGNCCIRTGPATSFKSIGSASIGDVFALPDTSNWTPIVYDGKVRWICNKCHLTKLLTKKV